MIFNEYLAKPSILCISPKMALIPLIQANLVVPSSSSDALTSFLYDLSAFLAQIGVLLCGLWIVERLI